MAGESGSAWCGPAAGPSDGAAAPALELDAVLDALPSSIAILDRQGVIVRTNAAWQRFAAENGGHVEAQGQSAPGFEGTDYLGLCDQAGIDEAAAAAEGLRAVLAGRRDRFTLEYDCSTPVLERWFELAATPIRDRTTGAIAGAVVMHSDVTERRLGAERRFRAFVEGLPDGAVAVDPEGRILVANEAAHRIFGLTPGSLPGRRLGELIPPRLRGRHRAYERAYFADPRPRPMAQDLAIVGWRPDGSEVPLEVSLGPAPIDGRTVVIAVIRDLTEQRRAEAERRRADLRFRQFMERCDLIGVTLDLEGKVVFANSYLLDITGWRWSEVAGADWFETFLPAEWRERLRTMFLQAVAGSPEPFPASFENPILTRDGRSRLIAWTNVIAHDDKGRVAGVTALGNDITDLRRTEERLRSAKDQAEQTSAVQSRVLSATGHDLRQPLQILSLLQGLLLRRVEDEETREVVEHLGGIVRSMAATIDTLLDITQIERGALEPQRAIVSVDSVLARLCSDFARLAGEAGLGFKVLPSSALVRTDPRLLERMVQNLVSNAIKYTDAGRVLVGCRRRGERLRIEVWDTGPGIAEAELGTVFEEYRRLAVPATDRRHGLGLGLAIVQRLGALLDHPVDVCSRPGRGSMFAIELPYAGRMHPAAPALAEPPAAGAPRKGGARRPPDPDAAAAPTVHIVEDEAPTRESLAAFLRAGGYAVIGHANAEALLADPLPRPRDCLIVDLWLGGADGVELIERLPRYGIAAPVIVLTGERDVETAVRAMRAGAVDFLLKPVDHRVLGEAVARALAEERVDEEEANAARERWRRLTRRERQVFALLVEGHANKEIAARLGISQRTAEHHRASVHRKMEVRSLAQLVRRALLIEARDEPR